MRDQPQTVSWGTFWADGDVLYLDSDGMAYMFVKTQQGVRLTQVILFPISMKLMLRKAARFGGKAGALSLSKTKKPRVP